MLPRSRARSLSVLAIAIAGCLLADCATLSQVAALRKVTFNLDHVSAASIAGVRLEGKRTYRDLSAVEIARLGAAVATKSVPLEMTIHIEGENPAENRVTARMIQLAWTLSIRDRETVSGRLDREFLFPPGEPTDVPLAVSLDLWKFFGGEGARDLFDLAMAAAGQGQPVSLSIKATPTIQTPIGPMSYPRPTTIVQRQVGSP